MNVELRGDFTGIGRLVAAIAGVALLLAVQGIARGGAQQAVRDGKKVDEHTPAVTDGYFAWTQNSKDHQKRFNAYVKPESEERYRVNKRRTDAYAGGFSGTTLVYQEVENGRSDLKFWDLTTEDRSDAPSEVNTKKRWEWSPSLSGDWLLFGRITNDDKWHAYLFNLATDEEIHLAKASGQKSVTADQVNGDYAVWTKCSPTCNVFRYQISTGTRMKVPNPKDKFQYSASVTSTGDVYFGRSGPTCGTSVKLRHYSPDGDTETLVEFNKGVDFDSSHAFETDAGVEVYYERVDCDTVKWDIYKVLDSP